MAEVRNIQEHRTLKPGEDTVLQCKVGGGEYDAIYAWSWWSVNLQQWVKGEHLSVADLAGLPQAERDAVKARKEERFNYRYEFVS